ncbi:MAG: CpaF family protein [Erysipelotrichales bacterium]|nr:MAG: CpaF family protein [Erysipelotrichales bacterium]
MNSSLDFGILQPFVDDDKVTDINYNGIQCWIDHLKQGRFTVEPFTAHEFMHQLAFKLANRVNLPFNTSSPVVEAEFGDLRISMVHASVCPHGMSLSLRKTPATCRLNDKEMLKSGYCEAWVIQFLKDAVLRKRNILVSGLPGAGKTELVKYLMQFIPAAQRVITIEDTLELRYGDLYPHKDHVMMKISDHFDVPRAIRTSLRQRPDWICVSEVRGIEVVALMQSVSTGANLMSTIHAESAAQIPQRILHMMPGMHLTDAAMRYLIYEAIDIGIHLECRIGPNGIKRKIREIVMYYVNDQDELKLLPIYSSEKRGSVMTMNDLPKKGGRL